VLLVEDSPDVAWLASFHLRDAGCDVVTISDEWPRLFDAGTWRDVDVAVVDLHLGGDVTGVDVLRWLAEHSPAIRRVVFTASITSSEELAYREAHELCDAFVPKLDVATTLVEAVRV
jgi:CheY-like chemotaxis protein